MSRWFSGKRQTGVAGPLARFAGRIRPTRQALLSINTHRDRLPSLRPMLAWLQALARSAMAIRHLSQKDIIPSACLVRTERRSFP